MIFGFCYFPTSPFSGNEIGNDGAKCIAEALKENKSVVDFNLFLLYTTTITIYFWISFLYIFFLKDNKIGEEGGRAIEEALEKNTSITKLNLGVMTMSVQLVLSFFIALSTENRIKAEAIGRIKMNLGFRNIKCELDLSGSKIDDSSCAMIAEKLKACNTTKIVNLSGKASSHNQASTPKI